MRAAVLEVTAAPTMMLLVLCAGHDVGGGCPASGQSHTQIEHVKLPSHQHKLAASALGPYRTENR